MGEQGSAAPLMVVSRRVDDVLADVRVELTDSRWCGDKGHPDEHPPAGPYLRSRRCRCGCHIDPWPWPHAEPDQ